MSMAAIGRRIFAVATIVNTMINQLSVFTSEVTRVGAKSYRRQARRQAQVPEVTGVWKDPDESVNSMANNLTGQVRNIAEVTIAVANGDLSTRYRRRPRRNPAAERSHNDHGGPVALVRLEVTRVAREAALTESSAVRRIVPGGRRHMERPDRLRQRDVRQPDRPGAQYRQRHHGGRARRPLAAR